MDERKRGLERAVRTGDHDAAQELVRLFERCGFEENPAWRWHADAVASQATTWGEGRVQTWLSRALFGLFLERYGVDTIATGLACPRRVAELDHRGARCVCAPDAWLDHVQIFGRGSETPVVLTSQPYQAPEGRRWASVERFSARNGLALDVQLESASWHNPGFSRLIVLSRAGSATTHRAADQRAAVTG